MLVGLHRKYLLTLYLTVLRPVIFVASSNMSSGPDPNANKPNTAGGGGSSPGLPGAPSQGLSGTPNQGLPDASNQGLPGSPSQILPGAPNQSLTGAPQLRTQELTSAPQRLTGARQGLPSSSQDLTPNQDLTGSSAPGMTMPENVPVKKVQDKPILKTKTIVTPNSVLEKAIINPDARKGSAKSPDKLKPSPPLADQNTGQPCPCPTNMAPAITPLIKYTKKDEQLPSGSVEAGKYSVAYVTVPSMDVGKTIAHGLVKNKLAACVNIIPQVLSIYEWENKIEQDTEALLMIKTRTSAVDKLTTFVRSNHPYTVCEVISMPITNGNYKYLKWIGDNVLSGKPSSRSNDPACDACCDECL